ncbi:MAG: single-stranded-DNA-specific exonuclease RecJ [Nitrospirales bacterium]
MRERERMGDRRWVIHEVNREQQVALARDLSISTITASVLLARGVATQEEAHQWLSTALGASHDPYLLPDMELAIHRLHRAVRESERICFYGDYDVDGVSATSIYVTFFQSLGAHVTAYIPHREKEGYGLNAQALHRLRQSGVGLLVTSDCGTAAQQEIEVANQLGFDVIVTDHHQVSDRLPPALAVVNPHRVDSVYKFTGLCSGGLAYKVVQAYQEKYGNGHLPLDSLLDLVALSTVADVVPLVDENRRFVTEGLMLMTRGSRAGIRALKHTAGVDRTCTTDTVMFQLAPRINAAGRLDHAEAAVQLLTTESDLEARRIALRLEELNRTRRQIERETTAQAAALVCERELPAALVVWARHWHLGVVGIVAARLVERYHRPAVVVTVNGRGVGKGSARSMPGFDVFQALCQCRDLLEGFGGHPSAAGLTIRESRLVEFQERLASLAEGWAGRQSEVPPLRVDAEVNLAEVDARVVRELEKLHPFGVGNPEPTFAVKNLRVLSARVVGDRHLKVTVRDGHSRAFDGIGYRMGSLAGRWLSAGGSVDLAFMPEFNRWNGLDHIQLRIKDVKASLSV